MTKLSLLITALVASHASSVVADDWPHWRGPERTGVSTEKGWSSNWPVDGPKILWKAEIGIGYSAFSVADSRVYTAGHARDKDTVFCFDAVTGKEIWKHSYDAELGDKYYEGGPSATPTVDDGKVYHLSRWGDAFCFDAKTGKIIWEKNLIKETSAELPDWGFAGSPVIQGDLVILNLGEKGTAVEKSNGKVKWKSGKNAAGYSTALPLEQSGKHLAILSSGKSYCAIEVMTGKQIWDFPWPTQHGVNAADPIVKGDEVFISAGYEKGCALIKISGSSVSTVWQNKEMRNQFNPCVLVDGYLYGPDGNNGKASLKCLEWKTGKTMWSQKAYGTCGVTVADGKIIALAEKGELMVAPVSPSAFKPTATAQILTGRCWTTPVLSHGRLYCRNATGSVVCLDMASK